VLGLLRQGYTDVVDADLSKYFDTIPHDGLMLTIGRRLVDPDMLRLVKRWLKAPLETTGEGWAVRDGSTGDAWKGASRHAWHAAGQGHQSAGGEPVHDRFLKHWRQSGKGKGEVWRAHIINYAEDFVIPADAFWDISPLRGLILSRG
jgi:RNA-directed DNA polymerase